MTSIISRFIKDDKGAVEIIESSLIMPALFMFLSLLFIISLSSLNKSLAEETAFYNSKLVLVEEDRSILPWHHLDQVKITRLEAQINDKNKRFKENPIAITSYVNPNSLRLKLNNGTKSLLVSKNFPAKFERQLDFLDMALKDTTGKELADFDLESIYSKSKEILEEFTGSRQ